MRLKELREEKNLTQQEVAQAIGTSQRNIGRWENMSNEPTANFLVALADFFQCSIDYLLERTDDVGDISISQKATVEAKNNEEKQLIEDYRSLPRQEKAQASAYVHYLAERRGNTDKRA